MASLLIGGNSPSRKSITRLDQWKLWRRNRLTPCAIGRQRVALGRIVPLVQKTSLPGGAWSRNCGMPAVSLRAAWNVSPMELAPPLCCPQIAGCFLALRERLLAQRQNWTDMNMPPLARKLIASSGRIFVITTWNWRKHAFIVRQEQHNTPRSG